MQYPYFTYNSKIGGNNKNGTLQMGLAFGYFNGFWWFFCFKNSGFVFNERVKLYFKQKLKSSNLTHVNSDLYFTKNINNMLVK
jgi:hypothetical protein